MINITYSQEETISLFKDKLKLKNNENAAELLYDLLATDYRRSLFVKCTMGIEYVSKYQNDDWVYVNMKYLPTWRLNEESTLKLPGVIEEAFIPCHITSIDRAELQSYHITFKCVKIGDSKIVEEGYMVEEYQIHKKVKLLGEILDKMLIHEQNN